jgi:hypothetical protein
LKKELANVIERIHEDQGKFRYFKSVLRERSKAVDDELADLNESKTRVMKEVSV